MNRFFVSVATAAVVSLVSAGPVMAGEWEVWTQKQSGNRVTVMTSFTGEGRTDEAQLDLKISVPFELVRAEELLKGSICAASTEKGLLRAVPPSGGGKALRSEVTEACMFVIRLTGKGAPPAEFVKISRAECSSSFTDEVPCAAKIQALK